MSKHMSFMFVVLSVIVFFLSGCTSGRYGDIIPDEKVDRDFSAYVMDADYNYYYSGPDVYPNVIIGVKKGLVLAPDLWKPLRGDQKQFREVIQDMQSKAREYGESVFGSVIRDHQGRTVGVWYSILRAITFCEIKGDKTIVVYPPNLVIFQSDGAGFAPTDRDK
ncbi:MAG: hypothetical protein N2317_02375 [Syntrophales bacterium]|nr:hypothetical protein [Syntrophales bacterium]